MYVRERERESAYVVRKGEKFVLRVECVWGG